MTTHPVVAPLEVTSLRFVAIFRSPLQVGSKLLNETQRVLMGIGSSRKCVSYELKHWECDSPSNKLSINNTSAISSIDIENCSKNIPKLISEMCFNEFPTAQSRWHTGCACGSTSSPLAAVLLLEGRRQPRPLHGAIRIELASSMRATI